MKPRILALSALLTALLLSGCWSGRVLCSFEEPFWASLGGNLPLRLSLARDALVAGYIPRVSVTSPQQNPLDSLSRDVKNRGYRTVVVGPLLSLQWREYAPRFPGTRFILIRGGSAAEMPPNALLLSYDHTGALKAAGYAAGVSVRDEQGGEPHGALGHRIGILLGSSSELSHGDTDAFASGVAEALDGGAPVEQSIGAIPDKAVVKSTIEGMRRDGVEIFLLGLGSLDPWCLEVLQGAGGCAVVGGWAVSGAFPQQVYLSVEEDIPSGIKRALGVKDPEVREVKGPVKLIVGKARAVPDAAKARVEGG